MEKVLSNIQELYSDYIKWSYLALNLSEFISAPSSFIILDMYTHKRNAITEPMEP